MERFFSILWDLSGRLELRRHGPMLGSGRSAKRNSSSATKRARQAKLAAAKVNQKEESFARTTKRDAAKKTERSSWCRCGLVWLVLSLRHYSRMQGRLTNLIHNYNPFT